MLFRITSKQMMKNGIIKSSAPRPEIIFPQIFPNVMITPS